MKATGIVRKVDDLGRIVLPIELRRTLHIDIIILKKYEPACIFCGSAVDVINHNGKNICRNCIEDLKNL